MSIRHLDRLLEPRSVVVIDRIESPWQRRCDGVVRAVADLDNVETEFAIISRH